MTDKQPKKSRRSQLEGIAFHDAGHAVIAYMKAQKIKRLSIAPKEGRCELSRRTRTCLHDAAVWLMAGPAAETRYWGRSQPLHMSGDIDTLIALGAWEKAASYFAIARGRVRLFWPTICELAGELLQAGKLNGKVAEQIIDEAWQRQQKEMDLTMGDAGNDYDVTPPPKEDQGSTPARERA